MRPSDSADVGLYGDPAVYDLLYTPGTAAEVSGLERIARRFVARRHLVWLEPACGTGRYLRVLAGRGHRVIGFDRSAAMLAYARQRLRQRRLLRRASLFRADMRSFGSFVAAGSIDVAFNPVNTIRHLDSDAAMLQHLGAVARVLRPGGIYAIGISLSSYGGERIEEDVWEARRGRCTVRQVVQYLPPGTHAAARNRIEMVVSHLTVERPAGVTHHDSIYPLRCYDARQWERLLGRSALRHVARVDPAGRVLDRRISPYAIDLLRR